MEASGLIAPRLGGSLLPGEPPAPGPSHRGAPGPEGAPQTPLRVLGRDLLILDAPGCGRGGWPDALGDIWGHFGTRSSAVGAGAVVSAR